MIFASSYKHINNLTLTPPQHKYINYVGNFSPGGFFVGLWCCSRRSKLCSQLSPRTRLKRVYQRSTKSHGFYPGAPVSSHRVSWQGGLG
jgi:hypothetical protein